MNYRNDFKIVGRIISKKQFNDENTRITLLAKTDRVIYPAIICKTTDLPAYKAREYIEIMGYAQSEPITTKNGETLVPRLKATSVTHAKTMLEEEFGAKGRFWQPNRGRLCISGTIASIEEDDSYAHYVITTEEPVNNTPIPVQINWKKIDRHPSFTPGDKVCAICQFVTPKKNIGTEERIFLNINALDMALLEN